jgi:branched-chain amino acid transport system permease protein
MKALVGRLIACLLLGAGLLAGAAPARAETSLGGTLRVKSADALAPVAGVGLTAQSVQTGQTFRGTSGQDGRFEIPLPSPGQYRITLDTNSLPAGVALPSGRADTLTVDVQEGQRKLVLYPLEKAGAAHGGRQGPSPWARVPQVLLDGTVFGLIVAMAAVGLSLIYSVSRIINFAHGEFMTLGALLAYLLSTMAGGPHWPLIAAAAVAVLAVGALGGALGTGLLRPLESRAKEHFSILVFTIGLSFAMRYLLLAVFEANTLPYREYALQEPLRFAGLAITPRDLVVCAVAVLALVGLGVLLLRTRLGRAMRAVAGDPALAEATGIDVNRIKRDIWIVGSALAATGGVLMAVSHQVRWDMGYQTLMFVFAAVILGGIGTAFGTIAGGVVLGICMELSTLVFPVELKTALAMLALTAVLLVRPQGLFNRVQRVG